VSPHQRPAALAQRRPHGLFAEQQDAEIDDL
jgi:hypothetical protein